MITYLCLHLKINMNNYKKENIIKYREFSMKVVMITILNRRIND